MRTRRSCFKLFACLAVAGATLLASAARSDAAEKVKPLRALLVIGGCCHDYAKQQEILAQGIAARAHVEVTVAYEADKGTKKLNPVYESPSWAQDFDVIIHDECSADVKDLALVERILAPHRQGIPGVVLHCGMHCYRTEGYPTAVTPWFEFTGLQSTGHGPQQPIAIEFVAEASPITKGMANWTTVNEELYNNITGKLLDTATALARGKQIVKNKAGEENTAESVVVWTNTYAGKAKVFSTTLGHNNATVADPRYLDMVTRGLLWSCGKLEGDYLKPFDPAKQTTQADEKQPTLAPKR